MQYAIDKWKGPLGLKGDKRPEAILQQMNTALTQWANAVPSHRMLMFVLDGHTYPNTFCSSVVIRHRGSNISQPVTHPLHNIQSDPDHRPPCLPTTIIVWAAWTG